MVSVLILIVLLLWLTKNSARYYCPPANFVENSQRPTRGFKTAIVTEIHGQLWAKTHNSGSYWTEYYNGNQLARNIFNHAGILGVDKIYLGVFYNQTVFPNGPTVEEIYPSRKYCIMDWYKLGVFDWRPVPYGGPVENWPLDKDGKPTEDIDYYKTLRVYNPFYSGDCKVVICDLYNMLVEIKRKYDWIFVMDPDEYLNPVNFNISVAPTEWCSPQRPPLASRIIHHMLATATRYKLGTYDSMMKSFNENDVLSENDACPKSWSFSEFYSRCRPITSITIPVYVWIRKDESLDYTIPTIRSVLPSPYLERLKSVPQDGQEELWKSVYQTKHSLQLQGRTLHDNPVDPKHATILAPRQFHGGLSLEISHLREYNLNDESAKLMVVDRCLIDLLDSYKHCMRKLPNN